MVYETTFLENEYVSFEKLYEAYIDCRKRKTTTTNCFNFEINERKELYKLYLELNNMTYEIGKSITFCVDRPVKREVFAADFRDRIVHHLLINDIMYLFENEFIDDSYSCRVGKGTYYGVMRCYNKIKQASRNYTKDCYIVKCDLKSFFMTIDKNRLFSKLEHFIKDKYEPDGNMLSIDFVLYLIKKIIFNEPQNNCIRKQSLSAWDGLPKEKSLFHVEKDKGLPIGNLTSQIFANFYLSEFDHFMVEELGLPYYGRYVDDFYFIVRNKKNAAYVLKRIKEKLDSLGVLLHPKKLYIQHWNKGTNFIGATLKPNRVYIGNRTKGNFYQSVKYHSKSLEEDDSIENVNHIITSINSYLGFLKHYKTRRIIDKYMLRTDFSYSFYKYFSLSRTYGKVIPKYIYKINNKKYSETMFEERKLLFKKKHWKIKKHKSSSN